MLHQEMTQIGQNISSDQYKFSVIPQLNLFVELPLTQNEGCFLLRMAVKVPHLRD
jgi:hypothetical protein